MSADLPITSAKIKAALVANSLNLPNGASNAGEFVFVKASTSGMTYEF